MLLNRTSVWYIRSLHRLLSFHSYSSIFSKWESKCMTQPHWHLFQFFHLKLFTLPLSYVFSSNTCYFYFNHFYYFLNLHAHRSLHHTNCVKALYRIKLTSTQWGSRGAYDWRSERDVLYNSSREELYYFKKLQSIVQRMPMYRGKHRGKQISGTMNKQQSKPPSAASQTQAITWSQNKSCRGVRKTRSSEGGRCCRTV